MHFILVRVLLKVGSAMTFNQHFFFFSLNLKYSLQEMECFLDFFNVIQDFV